MCSKSDGETRRRKVVLLVFDSRENSKDKMMMMVILLPLLPSPALPSFSHSTSCCLVSPVPPCQGDSFFALDLNYSGLIHPPQRQVRFREGPGDSVIHSFTLTDRRMFSHCFIIIITSFRPTVPLFLLLTMHSFLFCCVTPSYRIILGISHQHTCSSFSLNLRHHFRNEL